MKSYSIFLISLTIATLLFYVVWNSEIMANEKPLWNLNSSEIKKIPKISSKEAEINRTIVYLAHHAGMPENSHWISLIRNLLFNLSTPLSVPSDALEKSKETLLSTVVPPVLRIVYTETWKGYRLPVFTFLPGGRLGNVLMEYCTMYAIHNLYNVSVFVRGDTRRKLKAFPNLSLPKLPGPYNATEWQGISAFGRRKVSQYTAIELAAAGLLGPHQFVLEASAAEVQLFHLMKEDIRRELLFSTDITAKAQTFLASIKENIKEVGYKDVIYIGFHVRRTDYVAYIKKYRIVGGVVPEDKFYDRAIQYYRKKFPRRAVFVAASDDASYVREKLGNYSDVFFTKGTPSETMGILSSCNHSIMTFGTYGFFCSFLTGGEVVYPDIKFKTEYILSRARYEKMGLSSFTPLPID